MISTSNASKARNTEPANLDWTDCYLPCAYRNPLQWIAICLALIAITDIHKQRKQKAGNTEPTNLDFADCYLSKVYSNPLHWIAIF